MRWSSKRLIAGMAAVAILAGAGTLSAVLAISLDGSGQAIERPVGPGSVDIAPVTVIPVPFDTDGDGFYDQLESALGSNPGDNTSTPESYALPDADGNGVADVCEDFADNDRDGLTDGADPGCVKPALMVDLEPGLDVFKSLAPIEAEAFGPGFPPEPVDLEGPTVIKRGEPQDTDRDGDLDTLPVEIVAMQLTSVDAIPVTLIENPNLPSTGEVSSATGAPPWSSFFDVFTLIHIEGVDITEVRVRVENPSIATLPPVQEPGKVDPTKCYQFVGGRHCPEGRFPKPVLKYVAKFDCGEMAATPPPFMGEVKPGDYATKIVIHNPQGVPVTFEKKASESFRNPEHGPVGPFRDTTLGPDESTFVDCLDILRLLGRPSPAPGEKLAFFNGVVVILSPKKLDVIANYTQEIAKETITFEIIRVPRGAPAALATLVGKRLKEAAPVNQLVLIDEVEEVKDALRRALAGTPNLEAALAGTTIRIVDDSLGVGSSMDVEVIEPQKCLLLPDPPAEKPLDCEVKDPH